MKTLIAVAVSLFVFLPSYALAQGNPAKEAATLESNWTRFNEELRRLKADHRVAPALMANEPLSAVVLHMDSVATECRTMALNAKRMYESSRDVGAPLEDELLNLSNAALEIAVRYRVMQVRFLQGLLEVKGKGK